jgi:hypothetical protein
VRSICSSGTIDPEDLTRSSSISPDDIPDLVMCLLLTGVDPGTSIEEKLRITAALGALGNRIETPEQVSIFGNSSLNKHQANNLS